MTHLPTREELIAAPDLLAVCKMLIRYDESKSVPASMYRTIIESAKAAISKAEKEATN